MCWLRDKNNFTQFNKFVIINHLARNIGICRFLMSNWKLWGWYILSWLICQVLFSEKLSLKCFCPPDNADESFPVNDLMRQEPIFCYTHFNKNRNRQIDRISYFVLHNLFYVVQFWLKNGIFVCIIPGGKEIDLKKAAVASLNKKAAMIKMTDLEPLTGYIRGGCSPLGMKWIIMSLLTSQRKITLSSI